MRRKCWGHEGFRTREGEGSWKEEGGRQKEEGLGECVGKEDTRKRKQRGGTEQQLEEQGACLPACLPSCMPACLPA